MNMPDSSLNITEIKLSSLKTNKFCLASQVFPIGNCLINATFLYPTPQN